MSITGLNCWTGLLIIQSLSLSTSIQPDVRNIGYCYFSTVGKFRPVSNFTELHALNLAPRSYMHFWYHTLFLVTGGMLCCALLWFVDCSWISPVGLLQAQWWIGGRDIYTCICFRLCTHISYALIKETDPGCNTVIYGCWYHCTKRMQKRIGHFNCESLPQL